MSFSSFERYLLFLGAVNLYFLKQLKGMATDVNYG